MVADVGNKQCFVGVATSSYPVFYSSPPTYCKLFFSLILKPFPPTVLRSLEDDAPDKHNMCTAKSTSSIFLNFVE